MQRKCLRAIEVLANHEAPRKHLREINIGDSLLEIVRLRNEASVMCGCRYGHRLAGRSPQGEHKQA